MPITYEVRKIIEKDVDNDKKRDVTVIVEKVMGLSYQLEPLITTFRVTYPVWDGRHLFHSVDTTPPCKSLNHLDRIGIADALKAFN